MADAAQALTEVLERFGLEALIAQPNLCRNTLRDKLPDDPREASLLITALESGVPTRLRAESRISGVDTLTAQLAGGLERSHGLSPAGASWAVRTWAAALGLAHPQSVRTVAPSEAGTVLRLPVAPPTVAPPTAAPPTTAPPPAVPPVPWGSTTASSGLRGPGAPSGPATVLRAGPGAGSTSFPSLTPSPPGRRRTRPRRTAAIVAIIVLVAVVAGVAAYLLHRSDGSSPAATGTGSRSSGSSPASTTSGSASATTTPTNTPTTAFAPISPVLAHRGDHEGYPQETLPAFIQAGQRGFTVETDVRWTKDDVPIINHDPTTGNGMICQGGPLVVADTTWAVLHSSCATAPSAAKTHQAYGIPTLDDTIAALSRIRGATVFAELKIDQTQAQNRAYLAILRKWKMTSRTVATSFVSSYLQHFTAEAAAEHVQVRTLRFAAAAAPTTLADLRSTHVWGVVLTEPWDAIPGLVTQARGAGIDVGIATLGSSLDGTTEWAKAKQLGADFVLTDKPSEYHTWLEQH